MVERESLQVFPKRSKDIFINILFYILKNQILFYFIVSTYLNITDYLSILSNVFLFVLQTKISIYITLIYIYRCYGVLYSLNFYSCIRMLLEKYYLLSKYLFILRHTIVLNIFNIYPNINNL